MPERDRPEIDLDRDAFRPVFTGPLARPRDLKVGLAICAGFTLLGIWGAWYLNTWWSGVFPVPPAIMMGIAIAGLEPGYWFRNPPHDNT